VSAGNFRHPSWPRLPLSTPICKTVGKLSAVTLRLPTRQQASEQDLTIPEARTEAVLTITRLKGFGAAAAAGLIVFVGLSGPSLKRLLDWLVLSLFHEEHPELAQAVVEPIVGQS